MDQKLVLPLMCSNNVRGNSNFWTRLRNFLRKDLIGCTRLWIHNTCMNLLLSTYQQFALLIFFLHYNTLVIARKNIPKQQN